MPKQKIQREVPIEECLNGNTREESNLDEDAIEDFVEWTKEIERSEALREAAREEMNEDDLPQAQTLFWVDQAEVYPLCSACYRHDRQGEWTGSTQNPNYHELKQTMQEKLREGCACAFCKSDRIEAIKEEIAENTEVEVVVLE